MARKKNGKASLTQRLSKRSGGLSKKRMSDGGAVYQGGLANKALKAVGARAMTMDNKIIVNSSFDSNKGDDVALYAHERAHDQGSGGRDKGDHNHAGDPEEMAARAVERMVLHKSRAGEDMGETLKNITNDMPKNQGDAKQQMLKALHADAAGEDREQAKMAYYGLLSQGYSRAEANRKFADAVTKGRTESNQLSAFRTSGNG